MTAATVIPLDPQDLDRIPPPDLDQCANCRGTGAIWPANGDPQDVEACPVCKGDGILEELS